MAPGLRSASLSVVLVAVAFIGNPSGTFSAAGEATNAASRQPRDTVGCTGSTAARRRFGSLCVFVPGLGHPAFPWLLRRGRACVRRASGDRSTYCWPLPLAHCMETASGLRKHRLAGCGVLASRCLVRSGDDALLVAPPLMVALVLPRRDLVRFGLGVICAVLNVCLCLPSPQPVGLGLPIVAGVGEQSLWNSPPGASPSRTQ